MSVIRLDNEAATHAFAQQLATTIRPGRVITLSGELGAGKSTFARALMRALGVKDAVMPSPTFALIQTYEGEGCMVSHMDWYRLEDTEAIEMLGVFEYFSAPWITIVEWAERAGSLIPDDAIRITLAVDEQDFSARRLTINRPEASN